MTDTAAVKTQKLLAQLHWVDAPLEELLDKCQAGLLGLEQTADPETFESVKTSLTELKHLLTILNIHGGVVLASEVIATGKYFAQRGFEQDTDLGVLFQSMVKLRDYLDFVRVYGYDHGMVLIDTINQLRELRKKTYLHEGELFDVDIVNELPDFAEPVKTIPFEKARSMWQRSLRDWLEIVRAGKTIDNEIVLTVLESIKNAVDALRSSSQMSLNAQLWFLCSEVLNAILDGSNNEDIRLDRLFARLDTYLSKQTKSAETNNDENIVIELIRSLLYFLSSCEPRSKRLKQLCNYYELTDVINLNSLAAARKSLKGSNKQLVRGIAAAVQTELQGLRDRIDQIKLHEEKISAKNYLVLIEDLKKELHRFAGSMELLNYKQTAISVRTLADQLERKNKKNNSKTIDHLIEKLLGVEARLFEDGNTRDGFSAKQRITSDSLRQAYDLGIIQLDKLQQKFDTIIKQRAGGAEVNNQELYQGLTALHQLASALNVMGEHDIAGALQVAGRVICERLQQSAETDTDTDTDEELVSAAIVVASTERYLIAKRDNIQTQNYRELIDQTLTELGVDTTEYVPHPDYLFGEQQPEKTSDLQPPENVIDTLSTDSESIQTVSHEQAAWEVDEDLFEIYREELEEVISALDEQVPILVKYPSDSEALTIIRRNFHTLKGSSRMIGANSMGQLGAASEFLMNAVLSGEVQAQDVIPIIQRAHEQVKHLRDLLTIERNNVLDEPARQTIMDAEAMLGTAAEDSVLIIDREPSVPVSRAGLGEQETDVADLSEQEAEQTDGGKVEEELPTESISSQESPSPSEDVEEGTVEKQSVFLDYPHLPGGNWQGDEQLLELIVDELKTHIELLDAFYSEQVESHGHHWQSNSSETIRATHTIGGALGLANQPLRQQAAQAVEEYLGILREQELELSAQGLELIRHLIDMVKDIMLDERPADSDRKENAEKIIDQARSLMRVAMSHPSDEDEIRKPSDAEYVAQDSKTAELLADDPFDPMRPLQLETSDIVVDSPFLLENGRDSNATSTSQFPAEVDEFVAQSDNSRKIELDYDEMDEELLHVFMDEADEISHAMHDNMQQWRESGERIGAIAGLRRNMHTIKGAANMAGLTLIGQQCDLLETQLEQSAQSANESDFDSIERSLDHLQEMLSAIKKRAAIPEPLVPLDLNTEDQSLEWEQTDESQPDDSTPYESTPDAIHSEIKQDQWVDLETQPDADQIVAQDTGAAPARRTVRVGSDVLERMGNTAGEVSIFRARMEQLVRGMRSQIGEAAQTIDRLRNQLRNLEIETEAQILARHQTDINDDKDFDPLELDRYSTIQQLSRSLSESANDLLNLNDSLENNLRQSEGILNQQANVSAELQDDLLQTRMVSIQNLAPRLQQVVRRAAQQSNKSCQLIIDSGTGSELDRNILEQITPSLEHILRNAVAHGIESPSQRMLSGKSEKGQIHLTVVREMTELVIQIRDDGTGLDREKIRQAAVNKGLIRNDVNLKDRELDQLIFSPGFSTAGEVSEIAGRGIGMDVVRTTVRQVGGNIEIESVPKQGTTISIRIPVTLALMQAVVIESHERFFAIPVVNLLGVTKISLEDYLQAVEEGQLKYAGEEYELYDIERILGQQPTPLPQGLISLLIVESGGRRVALRVAELRRHQELVVKSIGPFITSIPGITSGAISPEGDVILIIDVGALVRVYLQRQLVSDEDVPVEQIARRLPMILVVDDSITMRKVTSRVLEHNEMEVNTAKDGLEALEVMKERTPDLVLLDIEMPRMDGFELANYMKNDSQLRKIPIVIISSRSGEKHKQRAMEIGVNDFIGKPYQERELLTTVNQLLEQNPQFAGQLQRGSV